MIDYDVISTDVEGYNPTAKKIRFNDTIITEEHGELDEAVLVMSQGAIGRGRLALYVEDNLFIEGYGKDSIMWRLAEISSNKKIEIVDAENQ